MDENSFLGTGMKFPPQVDPGTGRFATSSAEASVKESVYLILMTHRGERWLEPDFGSRLMSYTFMDTSLTMLNMLASELRSVLLEQEPRLANVTVDIDPNVKDGCLLVNIGYTISQTNSQDNLVFPFYLNAAPEAGGESEGEVYA
jgi:phage baseplate assembly protein W